MTIELLGVACLKHDLLLNHVLNSPLHNWVLVCLILIVDFGRIFILQEELLLDVLWEQIFLLTIKLCSIGILKRRDHVHLGHVGNNFRVICYQLLFLALIFLSPILHHLLLLALGLLTILLERIHDALPAHK